MLVSIQLVCNAISLIMAMTMVVGLFRDIRWMRYNDGILRNVMFAFVVFSFVLTLIVSVLLRPY